MKCFHHHDVDAVGVCKLCTKGICPACATDLGYALACKDSHEATVREHYEYSTTIMNRNKKALEMQPKTQRVTNFFTLMIGVIFFAFGLWRYSPFSLIFGAAFILYWLYVTFYNARLTKKLAEKNGADKT